MEELSSIVAQNIIKYRTLNNLTQFELAEKLSYSDKSISKWENGRALPDVMVLKKLADLFGIKVDDLLELKEGEIVTPKGVGSERGLKHLVISMLAVGLVWLVATLVFVILNWLGIVGSWRCFIYAIPVSCVVSIVFCALWGKKIFTTIAVSLLVWTTLMCVYLTFIGTRAWLLFLIGIPLQALICLWGVLKRLSERMAKNINVNKKMQQ